MQSILCDCVPWLSDNQDQADQLLYGLAPIWPHTQVSLPSINSTWGDRRTELVEIWVSAHCWDMGVQGEAESLVCCLSFAATWDEVSLGHAQTLEVGNASRSTSLNIASVCLTCKASEDRMISCRVLGKKNPINKSMFALTVSSYTALMLLFSFHNDIGSVLITIFLLKPLFFIPMSGTATGFASGSMVHTEM